MNPNKRNLHQINEKSEILEKEKSEVINHFSSRNCFLIKYLCLRWRMAIFHYPFTIMKLSASGPFLSLIISFKNLDQRLPSTLRQVQEKFIQKSWTIKFWCSRKKYWTHPAESGTVQIQEKHKQEKKWGKISSWKGSTRNRTRRQKDKSQE